MRPARYNRAGSGAAGRNPAWRLVLVGTMLLAFTFTGYLTRTHIHIPASSSGVSDGFDVFAPPLKPGQNKLPGNDDPANCPICQQIAHGGQYLLPVSLVILLVVAAVAAAEPAGGAVPSFDAVSHNWRGRAPPRI